MPWKEKDKAMLREELVRDYLSGRLNKSEVCRKYGVSRPTGDKWINRALCGEDMSDRSKKPFKTVNRISPETEELIIEYRKRYPSIGAVKLHRILENEGYSGIPCPSTINAVFKRNGLMTKKASRDATPYKRFEMDEPNKMWQADFKGDFAMLNGQRCHTLNVLDDCTRFNLCCDPLPDETFDSVFRSMQRIFREYGLPHTFLCDNGNPWGVSQSTGFTRFEVWLMDLGILTVHGRIRHPQTQGKEERFNGSFTKECLNNTVISDLEDAADKFSDYRQFYNNVRPHHSLGLDTPASRYIPSPRKYPERIEPWEYPCGFELRKIKETGYFTYGGQGYFLSEAFGGLTVAVRESCVPGCISLFYRKFRIGEIDVDNRVFRSKKIRLADCDPLQPPAEK